MSREPRLAGAFPRRKPHGCRVLVLLVFLLASCRPGTELPSADVSDMDRLTGAMESGRWIEPRLTGGSAYTECERAECPAGRLLCEPACDSRATLDGHHLFSRSVSWPSEEEKKSAGERRAAALMTLIESADEAAAGEAIEMLQALVREHPTDAGFRNDLAAARIVGAQRSDDPLGLTEALASAQRAVELDPRLPEAHFNRALASTLLGLGPDAIAAWSGYLAIEQNGSPWAGEARAHLRQLAAEADPTPGWERAKELVAVAAEIGDAESVRSLIDPYRTAARLWIEEEVLPDWARAVEQGRDREAARTLVLARLVATELAALEEDRLLAHAVEAIQEAAANPRTNRLQRLVAGHRAYGEAAQELRRGEVDTAIGRYRRARDWLELAGSPFSAWADVGLALALFQEHRLPEALELLTRTRDRAEASGYPTLQGRVFWIFGLCQIYASLPIDSRHSYQTALERYAESGERENLANVAVRLAEVYDEVEDPAQAWRLRHRALRELRWVVGTRYRHYILADASSALLELNLPGPAWKLQTEAVRISRRTGGDPVNLAIALRHLAEVSASLAHSREAEAVLEEAADLSRRVSGPVGTAIRARILAVEGLIARKDSPQQAVEAFTRALDLLPRNEYLGYRAQLYVQRSAARRAASVAQGGVAELDRRAVEDLAAGLAEIDREWDQVLARRERGQDEEIWASYLGEPRETFDLMIRLLIEDGRSEEAFAYAEKLRARDLLDLVTDAATHRALDTPLAPLSARAVEERLPSGMVLVAYVSLEDRLVTWIVRRGRSTSEVVETSRAEIERWTEDLQEAAQADELDLAPEAREELSRVLLPPVVATARPGETLVFVPDGPLHGVPFAALGRPATGRFLLEDHPIAVAPSATLHIYALERDRDLPTTDAPAAFFLGDPTFEPSRFFGIQPLRHAREEARRCAAYYPKPTVLEAEAATREAFLRLAGRHDVIHFAGHALFDPRAPFKSKLVLAPSATGTDSGELYADELLETELPRTRLVVLSACSTAGGEPVGALGVAPLVRPFLGAGVPAVLGTLWDVEDAVGKKLLAEFHQRFRDGTDAATALQQASLVLHRDEQRAFSSPRSWAAYQVVGSARLRHRNPP